MLISDDYAALNRGLHETSAKYGSGGRKWADSVRQLSAALGADATILDYGCGKASLRNALPEKRVFCYDPAIPEFSGRPEPADLVVCTDVLEHVEPDCLPAVLADIASLTLKTAFLVVCTKPSAELLPDGSNAHRIVEGSTWWLKVLSGHFAIRSFKMDKTRRKAVFTAMRYISD